jgi:8-hydroxy-5-deazaflavin:NADPH oxidoreductase
MTISDSTVAIIGAGTIGGTLAEHFAAGGQYFLLAGRDPEVTAKLAANLDGHAEAVTVDEAVRRADVLVVAVWLDDFRDFIAQYGGQLAGKVIVDPSNPVGPDGSRGYRKVIGEQESSGQILAGLLPPGAQLVKAFGTLSAPTLSAAARRTPDPTALFYAADDQAAGDLVAELIRAAGFEPVSVGGVDQSIRIEMYGDLHEFGGLGRPVTKSEALAAI